MIKKIRQEGDTQIYKKLQKLLKTMHNKMKYQLKIKEKIVQIKEVYKVIQKMLAATNALFSD